MNALRTYEEVYLQNSKCPIYVVTADPSWQHYHPEDCPTPIRAWIEQHYPEVAIEKLSEFSFGRSHAANNKNSDSFLWSDLPRPLFRLGFSEPQAAHFAQAWSRPPLDTSGAPSKIYFLTNERSDVYRAKGEIDFLVSLA